MKKSRSYVITGASGAGKSTLLEALGDRGYSVVPEMALAVFQEMEGRGEEPLAPTNAACFMEEVLMRNRRAFETAQHMKPPVFFDRGIHECLAHMRLLGLSIKPELLAIGRQCRYAETVFVAEPWPEIYVRDRWRRFPFERAIRSFEPTVAAYLEDGYRTCVIPKSGVEERVAFVLRQVEADG